MKTPSMIIVGCVATTLLGGCVGARKAELQREIQALETRVDGARQRIVNETGDIGSSEAGMDMRMRYRPVAAWVDAFNARPAAERTLTYRQTSNGKIAKDDWDCGIFGSGGWYVEFNSSTATDVDLRVDQIALETVDNRLALAVPLDFKLRSKLHGHFDPCVGGGKGWRPRFGADKDWTTRFALEFSPIHDGKLPYVLKLESPNKLWVTVDVHLGDIGTLGIPITATDLVRTLAAGEISLLADQGGAIGPLPDGSTRTYRITTSNPQFRTTPGGIVLSTDIATEIAIPADGG